MLIAADAGRTGRRAGRDAAAVAAGAAAATMPRWTARGTFDEIGIVAWFKTRYNDPGIRPDRTASIRHEGGGRLDRLDLWIVVVLILGTMVLRTFRLDEPLQMHFDEVYHARTATEFLQDWRYGLSHDIYEWTHPHLAKYLMAAGIVLWGEDHVSATSDLEVPVVASVVEPRRIDEAPSGDAASDVRAGERLHVATGTEIRTYDLQTRDLISIVKAQGATALAIDDTNQRLVIGYDDGRLATLDLSLIGDGGVNTGLEPTALAKVDHPVDHLLVVNGGTQVIAASADRLTSVDMDHGQVIGSIDLAGIADLAPGGSGSAVVATVDEVTDPAAVASSLASILGTSAPDIQSRLASASPGTTLTLGDPGTGDAQDQARRRDRRWDPAGDQGGFGDACRGRDGCRRRLRRSRRGVGGHDDQAGRRGARPGDGDRTRQPEAVRDVRRPGEADATTSSRSVATRPRAARPTRDSAWVSSRCPGPAPGSPTTRPARWSTSSVSRRA